MNMKERLAQDLAALEAQMGRNPEVPNVPEATPPTVENKSEEVIVRTPEVPSVPEAVVHTEVAPVPVAEPVKPKRTDWKGKYNETAKRMAGLKASSDTFKFQTRNEIAQLKKLVEDLQSKPVVEVDPFEGLFSQEDKDVIGDEAVDIIQKATKAASENSTKDLKAEIDRLKQEAADTQAKAYEDAEAATYGTFLERLESKVTNYDAINRDPAFITYLQEVDDLSGYTKIDLLRRAESNGDVQRVADFMLDFEDKADPGKKKLEEMVGPTGAPSASVVEQPQPENIMKGSFIKEHNANVTRGRYKGRQAEAIKIRLEIDKALAEGRVNFRL